MAVVTTGAFQSPSKHMFHKFIHTYQKPYTIDGVEGQKRFQNFVANVKRINEFNENHDSGFSLGVNQFADENPKVLKERMLTCEFVPRVTEKKFSYPTVFNQKADAFDWEKQKKISRVKNQGSCGSCWAFSTTGAVEAMLQIRHNKSVVLSEQQLIDCSTSNGGCNGGLMSNAIDDINIMGGLYEEKDKPYTGRKNKCTLNYKKLVPETSYLEYSFIPPHDVPEIKYRLIHDGPLCSAVEVDPFHFVFYKEGIYDEKPKQHHRPDHAVLLVGFNETHTTPYWRIKNSWGTTWGENGYMRLRMDDEGEGVAGLHLYNMYLK